MEENIEHAKLRSLAQLLLDKKKGVEAFEDYMKEAFPYLETVKRRDREGMVKLLAQEVKRGAIHVSVSKEAAIQSRLRKPRIPPKGPRVPTGRR